jgi:N-acetylmuramoyl-L-alanine amidase
VLRPGGTGEAVRDLQRRLAALGFEVPDEELGRYGPATEREVRAFQERRALRVDGVCGRETWSALDESGLRLGDRMLYVRRPMLKGDDVNELQHRLNTLGFDAGKEDGIFGPDTEAALKEFQRNAGLATDGIFGPDTAAALERISAPRGGTLPEGSVASVREREELRRGGYRIEGRRIFLAVAPGYETLGENVHRGLAEAGALVVLDASGADDSELAAAANRYEADLFLGMRPGDEPGCHCSYYSSGRSRSEVGFRVATALSDELGVALSLDAGVCGRAQAALRETRMAAVLCEPAAQHDVEANRMLGTAGADVAGAVVRGVRKGLEETADLD